MCMEVFPRVCVEVCVCVCDLGNNVAVDAMIRSLFWACLDSYLGCRCHTSVIICMFRCSVGFRCLGRMNLRIKLNDESINRALEAT